MFSERMMVLNLVDEGIITVDQALALFEAMAEDLGLCTDRPAATIEFPKFCLVLG